MKKFEFVTLFSALALFTTLSIDPSNTYALENNEDSTNNVTVYSNEKSIYINPVYKDAQTVTGIAAPNQKVVVESETEYEISGITNDVGEFSLNIPLQEEGAKLIVTLLDDTNEIVSKKDIVVTSDVPTEVESQEKDLLNRFTIGEVTPTNITGKTDPNTEVSVVLENGEVIQGLATTDGNFNISIPTQQIGSKLIINAIENQSLEVFVEADNSKDLTEEIPAIIEEVILEQPQIEPLYIDSRVIKGKTIPNVDLTIELNDGSVINEKVKSNGIFEINIANLSKSKTISVKINNEAGHESELLIVAINAREIPVVEEIKKEQLPELIVPKKEEVAKVTDSQVPVQANMAFKATVQNGTTYYYIKGNDTLSSVARKYNVSVQQLIEWNAIANPNVIKQGTIISINGKNILGSYNKESKQFSTSAEFVAYIAEYAKKAAYNGNGKDLYASVMIAQSVLESGYGKSHLALSGNNLFGVKGAYNGYSIIMETWEEVNGKVVTIDDYFRLYPTFLESLLDNADKLRNGVSWNANYYNGAWVENTTNHTDATSWLTSRYATDSSYDKKLNSIIENFTLTQYDKTKPYTPLVTKNVAYKGQLLNKDESIYSEPLGKPGFKTIGNTKSYYGKEIQVFKETSDGLYALITYNGKEIGWISTKSLRVTSTKATPNEEAYNYGVWSSPSNGKKVTGLSAYFGKLIEVIGEKNVNGAIWVQFTYNDKVVGWVSKAGIAIGLNPNQVPQATNLYGAPVSNAYDYGIWSQYNGGSKVTELATYTNKEIKITKLVVDLYGNEKVQLTINGKAIGWVAKQAIEFGVKPVNYTAMTVEEAYNYGVWSDYKGNNKRVAGLNDYSSSQLKIVKEAKVSGIKWVQFSANNKVIGWVSTAGIDTNVIPVSYTAMPMPDAYNYGVWNDYKGDNKRVAGLNNYADQQLKVIKETKAANGTKWVQFSANGKIIGWVSADGIDTNIVPVSYAGMPMPDAYNYGVWNDYKGNNKRVAGLNNYAGQQLKVIKETKAANGTKWVQFSANGKIIGWISSAGIDTNVVPVSYTGMPVSDAHNYGVWSYYKGSNKRVAGLNEYVGKQLKVVNEAKLPNGTKWVQFSANGKVIGWVYVAGIN
ncbi:GW dipeptide domain-containing protein [Carnobacterium inhibens]|uniref:GW dipeptide domain-containing protein n=1 Tax=Carnobacterium inhibens TaxID=147709 RepID=UPI00203AEBF3|nr:GW dipeptide domain-containing protein [Carnobacterium inhibens]MCM3511393.1 GW dipeptide domain-containing protein [Carnobacterium inhibens]